MGKTNIIGIRKSPKCSVYTFNKGDDFFELIEKFLTFVEVDITEVGMVARKLGGPSGLTPYQDFESTLDATITVDAKHGVINFCFGANVIFMTICHDENMQKEFSDAVFSYFNQIRHKEK